MWSGTQLYFVISFFLQVIVFLATAVLTLYPAQRDRFVVFVRKAVKYVVRAAARFRGGEEAFYTGRGSRNERTNGTVGQVRGGTEIRTESSGLSETKREAEMQKTPSAERLGTRRRLTVQATSSGSFFPEGGQALGSRSPQPQSHQLYNDDPAAAVVATKLKSSRSRRGRSALPELSGLGERKPQRVPLSRSISRTNCNAHGCDVKFQFFGLDKHHCKYCNGVFCSKHTAYISHSFYRRCDIDSQCVCPNCLPLKRKDEKRRALKR